MGFHDGGKTLLWKAVEDEIDASESIKWHRTDIVLAEAADIKPNVSQDNRLCKQKIARRVC